MEWSLPYGLRAKLCGRHGTSVLDRLGDTSEALDVRIAPQSSVFGRDAPPGARRLLRRPADPRRHKQAWCRGVVPIIQKVVASLVLVYRGGNDAVALAGFIWFLA